jgi:hypothetical protein
MLTTAVNLGEEKVKSFLDQLGGVAERSNAAVSKTVV